MYFNIFKNINKCSWLVGLAGGIRTSTILILFVALMHSSLAEGESPVPDFLFNRNKIHLPDRSHSPNLIQNSSFEDGLDWWVDYCWGTNAADPGMPLLSIDETTSVSGLRSLKQISGVGFARPVSTFMVPLVPGEKYTLSFYAKTDNPDNTVFRIWGCSEHWAKRLPMIDIRLTDQWQRYQYTFESPKYVAAIMLGNIEQKPGTVWIDNVQLEEGSNVTDYEPSRIGVSFVSNHRDHLSQPGEAVNGRVRIQSIDPESGVMDYELTDFWGNVLAAGSAQFSTQGDFEPVSINIPECDRLEKIGPYQLKTVLTLSDGYSQTDYHRLMKMKYMSGEHRNRGLFSATASAKGMGSFGWEQTIELLKRTGIGSVVSFTPPPAQLQQKLRNNGIFCYSYLFPDGVLGGKYALNVTSNSGNPDNSISMIPEEDIPEIVDEACQVVAENPHIVCWKTSNEPFKHTEDEIAKAVRILTAVRNGVKKINPDAKLLTPECGNLEHGLLYLESFFKQGGADACDAVGIHMYRPNPDTMDNDLSQLMMLVDQYMPGADIWATEGGLYAPIICPELGLPVVGGESYRANFPCYEMGLGERYAAFGYQLRYNIIGLKYASRLKVNQDWNYTGMLRIIMDANMVPTAALFAVNTPARLLGDADYIEDLNLGWDLRGYLFDDNHGQRVAALWYLLPDPYKEAHGPTIRLDSIAGDCEVMDCFGNVIENTDSYRFGNYPIFIRTSMSAEQLKEALENAHYEMEEENGHSLELTMDMHDDGASMAILTNRLYRSVSGMLHISVDGVTVIDQRVEFEPRSEIKCSLQLPPAQEEIQTVDLNVSFQPETRSAEDYSRSLAYLAVDRAPDDFNCDDWEWWDSVTGNRVPLQKSSAVNGATTVGGEPVIRCLWNANGIYFCFNIPDTSFEPSPSIQFPARGDSVQLYFDSWLNTGIGAKLYDQDDQSYDIMPARNGTMAIFRRQTPDFQLAFTRPGRVADTQGGFFQYDGGYQFAIGIPQYQIMPIDLEAGNVFGLNVKINDYEDGSLRNQSWFLSGRAADNLTPPADYLIVFLLD